MMQIFEKVYSCLTPRERSQSIILLLSTILMALFEMVSIGSVMPLISVISNPDQIYKTELLMEAYLFTDSTSSEMFISYLGFFSITLLVASAFIRTLTIYIQNRFIELRRHTLANRLFSGYLAMPYDFHITRSTSDLGRAILSDVDTFVEKALIPINYAISYTFVLASLSLLLFWIDPITGTASFTTAAIVYFFIYTSLQRTIDRGGASRSKNNQTRFSVSTEALNRIKLVKIFGREHDYLSRFSEATFKLAHAMAISNMAYHAPKYLVETLAFSVIIVACIVAANNPGGGLDMDTMLPALSLYAFAGYRMLPAVQNIYSSLSTLRFAGPAVDAMQNELSLIKDGKPAKPGSNMRFKSEIILQNVTYRYPNGATAISGVNLRIKQGEVLGIVGRTGSGKTTLVDLILGLLSPQEGKILIDGHELSSEISNSWQKTVSYVPQDVSLVDGTISENVAFGVDPTKIDMQKVVYACEAANIDHFIRNTLPDGYLTKLGDGNTNLSGGQRQRISIARALYEPGDILVFDEATSAQDSETENAVIDTLERIAPGKTLIIISHRTRALRLCTRVIEIESGIVIKDDLVR